MTHRKCFRTDSDLSRRFTRGLAAILALAITTLAIAGCTSDFGRIGGNPDSYDRKGEYFEVRGVTRDEMFNGNCGLAKKYKLDEATLNELLPQEESLLGLGDLASALVDGAFKFVQGQIKAEIARYEQSYQNDALLPDFWTAGPNGQGVEATYVGLLLRRETDRSRKNEEAAFEALFAMKPVEGGRFIILYPLYANCSAAKAKLLHGSDTVKIECQLDQSSMWIDEEGILQNRVLASIMWKQTLELETPIRWTLSGEEPTATKQPESTSMPARQPPCATTPGAEAQATYKKLSPAGVLVGPPLSASTDPPGGLMQIKATVTERDTTQAKEVLEKVQTVVNEQGPRLSEFLKNRLNGTNNADDAEDTVDIRDLIQGLDGTTPTADPE